MKQKSIVILIFPSSQSLSTGLCIAEDFAVSEKPANSSYYGEMFIPQSNFGKVKTGQKVLLKFQAYPDAEFGSVTGKIDFISSIPSDSGYLAKVSLPYGLITNYKKQIQFREGLIANGQIITENMRLLQRFYYNIFNQMKR
jgi:HlyD family secretion protein